MLIAVNSLEKKVQLALENVFDPEISTVSIKDLGMIGKISLTSEDSVNIEVLPTFLGCPALEIIKNNIKQAVEAIQEVREVKVEFIFHPPWTSDRITEKGREGLKAFGIAPPPQRMENDGTWQVDCPYCDSPYVTLENIFGPTACRSILYCKNCKNPFEAMKPISTI